MAAAALLSAPSARAQDKVNLAVAAINLAHAPAALAVAAPEIFARHGVALNVTDLRGASPNCIAALVSKAADLCQVGTTTGTDAIAEGADLVAVAALAGPFAEIILSSAAAAKLPVKADAPIAERIKALKGLNLVSSAPGSANYTMLDSLMGTVGSSIKDIRFRTLPEVPAMIEAIRHGQIDGAFWVTGSLAPNLVDGTGVRWISLSRGDVETYQNLPFVTVFARRDWAAQNADLVKRIHAGYADAIARLKNEPAQSSKLVKDRYFPDLDQALWNDGYEAGRRAFLDGARVSRTAWQDSLAMQAKSSQKDYSRAAFDKVVLPEAQAK
ncbi:ABC transporter substrate-binding protein [Alsobacter sp. SYSU M60028]|uniref:ABC transporter substrate-binding protein n=1 Tax=Alsobacter ponti TaxID=2962936 RepID=A0ABT1LEQ6_9HYPH|nr:ABC transporter substrate-binding protein [Alsobacter ponti]MCP8939934.1 ABC transporter substrate-binding protein [Alsobacter ponti]